MKRTLNAYTVYLVLSGATALFFSIIFTMASVYRVTTAGLNPLQLVLIGTALEAAVFIFEVPTGIIADVYSRRLSIIIGIFIIGAAFIVQGSISLFIPILITEAVWGLGYTFTSGAQEAWIADELGEADVGRAYLRAAQIGQVGALVGIGLSVALASIWLQLPIIAGGGLFVGLGFLLILVMPEQGFTPTPPQNRNTWQTMRQTLQGAFQLIRRQPVLVTILLIGAIYGMSSEAFDRLWEAHFIKDFSFPALGQLNPVTWFGIIGATEMLLGIAAVELIRRRVDTNSHRVVTGFLFAINAALMLGVIGFGLARNFELALATYLAARLARTTQGPLYTAWINQNIDNSQVRATVISTTSQANALGQVAGGPIVGLIGQVISISAAIVAAGIMLLPILLLYRLAIRTRISD